MEDAVIAALKVGGQPRQAAGQPGEEAVVEPPHPGLRLADDPRALAARPRHDLQLGFDIDDPETRDQDSASARRKWRCRTGRS